MAQRRSTPIERGRISAVRRSDLKSLAGSRWVQAALVTTALLTAIGAVSGSQRGAEGEVMTALPAVQAVLAGLDDSQPSTVEAAWRMHAVERESQRLAAQYTRQGYRVSEHLAREIHLAALKHDIAPDVAFGLVRAESSFRNQATSPVGAVGLTQLMPRTAAWIQPGTTRSDLRDTRTNLDIGFKYLRYLVDKYEGDTRLALLAYNRGPGTVDRAIRQGRNPDNGYADFVMGKENHGHRLYTRQRSSGSAR